MELITAGAGTLLPAWLPQRAALTPDRTALIIGEQRWDFRTLHHQVQNVVRFLREKGIGPGDRIAVLLRNGSTFVHVLHAASALGAVFVPLNVRLTARELAYQIQDARVRLLIVDEDLADVAAAVAPHTPEVPQIRASEITRGAFTVPETSPTGDLLPEYATNDLHSIIYTSGTTGVPKGARLTYGNHWWSAIASALNLGYQSDDCWLVCLPFFHVGGLSTLLKSVIYGMPAVVLPRFDPADVNATIDNQRVTMISVVSAMLQRMLDERADRPYPTHLRCVLLGGGPAPRPLLERCAALHIPVAQSYGLTETASQVATLAPVDALRKLGSAGKPLFPVQIRIDVDGQQAAAGVVGTILVRGPNVTSGYEGRPVESAEKLRDGWLHTGDLGYLDDEGYLYVLDRRDDLIISGGENVYPAEIEAVLLAHPAVAEAGVRGRNDAQWGQRAVATVVLRPGSPATPNELLEHCRANLAAYKVPVMIHFTTALPRNAAGKLLRRHLPA